MSYRAGSRRISVSADCIRRLVYCTTAADSARSADSLDHDDFPCALMINSSIRTYLRPADTVFLIPQESRMKKYFSTAWFSGVIYKIIGLGLVMLILWPLYIRDDVSPKPPLATFVVLTLFKLLSSFGGWKEQFYGVKERGRNYRAPAGSFRR